jgi:exoribonuclease-2
MVKECMIIAGEGAGTFASGNGISFSYLSQEADLIENIYKGFAGSYQLRRCMRPRILSVVPGKHQGLGLDIYTQVTSPLRRYTDLLAHIQLRAFLRGEKPLGADEVSTHLGYSEPAATAASQAERASKNHWTMVFLSDKKDAIFDAVALEKKVNRWVLLIPSLALETQLHLQKDVSPNENVKLILKSVNIPKGEASFIQG